jgi:acylphosphatase
MKRVHAVVRGRVQGVGFRAATHYEARRLGLQGWVRNQMDGTVEVLAAGDDQAVDELVAWLKQGPRGAHVTSLNVAPPAPTLASEELFGFEIR